MNPVWWVYGMPWHPLKPNIFIVNYSVRNITLLLIIIYWITDPQRTDPQYSKMWNLSKRLVDPFKIWSMISACFAIQGFARKRSKYKKKIDKKWYFLRVQSLNFKHWKQKTTIEDFFCQYLCQSTYILSIGPL